VLTGNLNQKLEMLKQVQHDGNVNSNNLMNKKENFGFIIL